MKVAFLIEYRKTPRNNIKRTPHRWLPIGVVAAPPELTPIAVLDRIRAEHPSLCNSEIRVRFFHPLPGVKINGHESNVLVIDSAVVPIVSQLDDDTAARAEHGLYGT